MTRRRLGGLLLLLAALYFAGEAWALAGWRGRPYDLSVDAISALGVPFEMPDGAVSTRHAAMNVTFIGSGLRALLAGWALAPFVPRWRWLVLPLVAVYALGLVLVGLSPAGETVHGAGALLAIGGGFVLLVALTGALRCHRGLAVWSVVCTAVCGLGWVLALTNAVGFGAAERTAVYAVVVWQVGAGLALLLARRSD